MSRQSVFRCAIYARKSHDDGGISGGHMNRPGLQNLIADIEAGLIDIIVVYKVDRLTRSLTDFAKLVDVFDASEVSFVSVTQAFNTTTSMGRLTLNVLLSFAQFEREVTAERIRDKIAASKKKGMWMGGTVPFGYWNKDRKLLIEGDEVAIVRTLFELYIQYHNVRLVKRQADHLGYKTRKRVHRSGEISGGKLFSRGHIYAILSNPIYQGKIQHKDQIYEGYHEAIIEEGVWEQVQSLLKSNAVERETARNSRSPLLLSGLVTDDTGQKLVPHHASKKGHRYHYYVSQHLKSGDKKQGWRIPARELEGLVQRLLTETLASGKDLLNQLPLQDASATTINAVIASAKALADQISNADHIERKALFRKTIRSIILSDKEITISLSIEAFDLATGDQGSFTITRPLTIKRRGQEMKMVIGGELPATANKDIGIIKLVAKAHALRMGLQDGSISSILEFATLHKIDHGDARRMLPLGYLAPDVIEAILSGHQPVDLTMLQLKAGYDLPVQWTEQRIQLGFPT